LAQTPPPFEGAGVLFVDDAGAGGIGLRLAKKNKKNKKKRRR